MATTRPGLLFEQTFDSGSDITALGFKYSGNKDVPLTTIAGQRAAKITLDHYKSEYSYRTEIQPTKLPSSHFDSGMFAKMNQEYWYGMRIYLDEGWREKDKADTVLMQFHSQPDAGEAWRNPPVALQVVNKNGEQHLNLIVRSDASKITTGTGEKRYDSSKQYDLGRIDGDIGKWTDLVWHVKWNYDGSGYLQLYKDGKIIADIKGANAFNDATGPYLKMGLYKYDWANSADTGPDSRTVYIDDFRVAGSGATYDTVAPGTVAAPVVPPPAPPAPTPTTPAPTTPTNSSTIRGTDGDDKLTGTSKNDVIDGGKGFDLLDLSKATAAAKVDLAAGRADMGGGHVDTVYNIEGVIGTSGNDTLLGNGGANKLRGGAGNDKIDGRAGDDILAGGDGNDDIIGGAGNDIIYGGRGIDILTGGTGSDRFVKEMLNEGIDYVTDFKSNDFLDLIALNKVVKATYGHDLTGEYLHFVQSGKATLVKMDVDGGGPIPSETLFHLDNVSASSLHLHQNVLIHESDLVS